MISTPLKLAQLTEKFNFDNRLQKFWNFLAGYADPRWRREQERRQSFYAAIRNEGEMFAKNIDKVVKRDYENGWDDASDLVSVASGTTEGATLQKSLELRSLLGETLQ